MILKVLLVIIGGFFGAVARFWVSGMVARRFPSPYPYGTLAVNGIGCFLIGFLWGLQLSEWLWVLLSTGFLGAFTTFSTFQWESFQLFQSHWSNKALVYMGTSTCVGLALTFIGYYIAIQ